MKILLTITLLFAFSLTAAAQTNFCLDSGASATASSTVNASFPASSVIDGDRSGKSLGNKGGWNDQTRGVFPDSITVGFGRANGPAAVGRVYVFTLANEYLTAEPDDTTSASSYGAEDFAVELLDASGNVVASQSVMGNDKAKVAVLFPARPRAHAVRVTVTKARDGLYSRITEVEAFTY